LSAMMTANAETDRKDRRVRDRRRRDKQTHPDEKIVCQVRIADGTGL